MDSISITQARRLWIRAQALDGSTPFGDGPAATARAIEHLGYVQIDTINVIERCHHHILFNRIPGYLRDDLRQSQTKDKSVFEYWTHALSYVPTRDFRYFIPAMRRHAREPNRWYAQATPFLLRKVLRRIRTQGPITIRDIKDDVLVDKDHEWAGRKPSKRALQLAFYNGTLVISQRQGMLKTYELASRHFDWTEKPRAATHVEVLDYRIDRALRSQGLVSLDSICHLRPALKPAVQVRLAKRVRQGLLRVVRVGQQEFWSTPETLDVGVLGTPDRTHILSPFDPLIIQRKRTKFFFGYDHLFEAYVPKDKRIYGYFGLPILVGDRIAAVVDLKTDRARRKLLVQKWTAIDKSRAVKTKIEDALHHFEKFQLES